MIAKATLHYVVRNITTRCHLSASTRETRLFVYITITLMMTHNALRRRHVTSELHGFLEAIRAKWHIILQQQWSIVQMGLRYCHSCTVHIRVITTLNSLIYAYSILPHVFTVINTRSYALHKRWTVNYHWLTFFSCLCAESDFAAV